MRCREPSSSPLVALTIKVCGEMNGRMRSNRARQCCEGITLTTICAPWRVAARSLLAETASGMRRPGRNFSLIRLLHDGFADIGFVRPEADAVRAFASEHDGEACAPCARADDGDLAHACLDPNAVFCAGQQTADVCVMLDDDEHRGHRHQTRGPRRCCRTRAEPTQDWERLRLRRLIPEKRNGRLARGREDAGGYEHRLGSDQNECAKSRGHSFASAKFQPDGNMCPTTAKNAARAAADGEFATIRREKRSPRNVGDAGCAER